MSRLGTASRRRHRFDVCSRLPGQLRPPASEVSGHPLRDIVGLDPDRAVLLGDVAVPALMGAGDPVGRFDVGESACQGAGVAVELRADHGGGNPGAGLVIA